MLILAEVAGSAQSLAGNEEWYEGSIPQFCPDCGEEGTIVRHGKRRRKVWQPNASFALVLFVLRVRCGRYPAVPGQTCGKVFTVLPSCLYPYRRYPLDVIQVVLVARFVDSRSWRGVMVAAGVGEWAARDWCWHFFRMAGQWLMGLLRWFANSPIFTSPRQLSASNEVGLLSLAAVCMDRCEQQATGKELPPRQVLQRLWEWGVRQLNRLPLLSTRFPEGGGEPVRPRGRDPDP